MATDTAMSPRLLEPFDAAQAADMLRDANQAGQAIVIRGHGTKANWGAPPSRVDAVLSVAALREPVDHCAGDLTVTAAAGVSFGDLNAYLAREGQWLPLDPLAGGSSTVGGLLATNDSGPRRVRYGAPRDLVIGVECILADGRRAKAGGRVVKNVAGYDLCRLLCGSFGSLALITSATFKLSPLPPASRTVSIVVDSRDAFAAVSRAVAGAAVVPSAFELQAESSTPIPRILIRFETTAAAADAQAGQVIEIAGALGAKAQVLQDAAEESAWARHAGISARPTSALLRLNLPSASVAMATDIIASKCLEYGLEFHLAGRIPMGALLLAVDGQAAAIAGFATTLREWTAARSGYVAVLSGPPAVSASVATWNDVGMAATRVMRAIKAQFDPHGTLCSGGGPAGVA